MISQVSGSDFEEMETYYNNTCSVHPPCYANDSISITGKSCVDRITRIEVDASRPTYSDIFKTYICGNRPCILSGSACFDSNGVRWKVFEWCKHEGVGGAYVLNKQMLQSKYGSDVVPVAQCSKKEFDSHPKVNMTLEKYLSISPSEDNIHYVKDYHFCRLHPDDDIYECPIYFTSDWLNEYCTDKGTDDYKFVYFGPKGSWTPFHADVLRSFSWSANVVGRKLWILYEKGKEELLCDRAGNLPFDVKFIDSEHPSTQYRMEIVQEAGEIIFIPSGWHHQVHNLEETLSINHNWFNGCNIMMCWEYMLSSLDKVEQEISDCRGMEDWTGHCQVLLRAYIGFSYHDFFDILEHIARKRMVEDTLTSTLTVSVTHAPTASNYHYIFDLKRIASVLSAMLSNEAVQVLQVLHDKVNTLSVDITKYLDKLNES